MSGVTTAGAIYIVPGRETNKTKSLPRHLHRIRWRPPIGPRRGAEKREDDISVARPTRRDATRFVRLNRANREHSGCNAALKKHEPRRISLVRECNKSEEESPRVFPTENAVFDITVSPHVISPEKY